MLGLGGNGMNPGAQRQPESGRSQRFSRGHCVFLLGSALAHARSSAYPRQGCFLSPTAVETATQLLPRLRSDCQRPASIGWLRRQASTKPGEICLWDAQAPSSKEKSVVASQQTLGVGTPASGIGCSAGIRLLNVVGLCGLCGSRHVALVPSGARCGFASSLCCGHRDGPRQCHVCPARRCAGPIYAYHHEWQPQRLRQPGL